MRALLWLSIGLGLGCGGVRPEPCEATLSEGVWGCDVPGWDDRAYTVVVPASYASGTPMPVLLEFHGGGGSRKTALKETCSDGDATQPDCIHNDLAEREGFLVVFPDGHPGSGLSRNLRSWNAGGGEGIWRATGAGAVAANSDDTQYVRDLLDDLSTRLDIDASRIYATGLSNGGAMSHRLACTLSDRIAAVAPIGGGLQWTTTQTCEPERAVPLLYIHSEADPCWVYDGGPSDCPIGQPGLEHVSVDRTLEEWSTLHGCRGDPVEDALPDVDGDGHVTRRFRFQGCDAELTHLAPEQAGHTWPDGHQYLGARTVGAVDRDWGDEQIWAFLSQHSLP